MTATYTQRERTLQLETPLGADALLLTGFSGFEELSRLFSFRLEMMSPQDNIAFNDIVGKKISFNVLRPDGQRRYFSGHVSRFSNHGKGDRLSTYSCEVVPWLWFLTRTTNCRVFQDKTVADILEAVFGKLGFSDYEINGGTRMLEYCVQYRETDFNFVTRLMEEHGMFYFFRHEQGKHTLVIGDRSSVYEDAQEKDVQFLSSQGKMEILDNVSSWEHSQEFASGKVTQRDYDYGDPSNTLETTTQTTMTVPGVKKYEMYDYPGRYKSPGDGDDLARLRMEEHEAAHDTVKGAGTIRSLSPGLRFTVKKHRMPGEEGKSYVLTTVQHQASIGTPYVAGGSHVDASYRNSFTCIPDSVTFRPRRSAYKPMIYGAQTAFVVGPSGEEVYTDHLGRVKVQFHWDREGQKDEGSSLWVRVAQAWAGFKWGALFIPRIGHEVVVQFLEGDIDRPLIVGSVYNEDSHQPYADEPSQSGIKTQSLRGGSGSNELRFDDKGGSEQVYFHAEKDFQRIVENNDDLKVGSSNAAEGSQTIEIWKDRTETVKTGNEKVTIEQGNRDVIVKTGNDTHTVETGNREVIVQTGNDTHKVQKGNREVTIEMGNDALTIKMGNQTTKLDLGKSETEAMQSIEFKVGQSSIKIDQMGVTIKGMMVKVEGDVQTQVKGLMTEVSGTAMLQAKGGLTMIG